MWAFKTLHDKGLVYEGFRVLPYCWRDETPLSQHRDPDGRRRLPDAAGPGGHRRVPADDEPSRGARPWCWTTTPWTLPSNLGAGGRTPTSTTSWSSRRHRADPAVRPRRGAAVGVRARAEEQRRRGRLRIADQIVERLRGADLVGRRYTPPFDLLRGPRERPPGARAPTSSPPTTAPASSTSRRPSVRTTRRSPTRPASRRSCRSTRTARSPPVADYAGMQVFDANQPIIDQLKANKPVHRATGSVDPGRCCCATRPTSTPTRTAGAATQPLIYKAVSSWFVRGHRSSATGWSS